MTAARDLFRIPPTGEAQLTFRVDEAPQGLAFAMPRPSNLARTAQVASVTAGSAELIRPQPPQQGPGGDRT
jgi:hypothetical protein